MTAQGCEENGLSWADGQLEYDKLRQTTREAVSGYAHLYAYGVPKTRFLTELLAQPVRNLADFECPQPHGLKAQFSCSMPCHMNYLNRRCATRNAHTLFEASPSFPQLSAVRQTLPAIPPRLIRLYHSSNYVIFFSLLQLYKKTLTAYTSIGQRRHVSRKASTSAATVAAAAAHNLRRGQ